MRRNLVDGLLLLTVGVVALFSSCSAAPAHSELTTASSGRLAVVVAELVKIFGPTSSSSATDDLSLSHYHCGRIYRNGSTSAVSACLQVHLTTDRAGTFGSSLLLRILSPFTSADVQRLHGRIGEANPFPQVLSQVSCASFGMITGYASELDVRSGLVHAKLVCHQDNGQITEPAFEISLGRTPDSARGAVVNLFGTSLDGRQQVSGAMIIEENPIEMTMKK